MSSPEYRRAYYLKNRDRMKAQSKKWSDNNRARRRETQRLWRKLHPALRGEKQQSWSRNYYQKNKEEIRKKWDAWRDSQHEDFLEYRRLLRLSQPEHLKKKERAKNAARHKNNLHLRIRKNLTIRLTHILSGSRKSAPFLKLLGCSVNDFKIYIESKFDVGMNWENYGKGCNKWNLDHIVPCALFDLTKPEHQKRCFHFSNYQPMWQPDNARKHSKSDNQLHLL